jgi:hypothetical protein
LVFESIRALGNRGEGDIHPAQATTTTPPTTVITAEEEAPTLNVVLRV